MPEILVVGAGLAGMSFALAARQRGFDVEVHDLKAAPVAPDELAAQVIAVNRQSQMLLSALDVWQRLSPAYCTAYTSMAVFDGESTGAVSFSADDANLSELGHIVDQPALQHALAEAAEAAALPVHWESAVDVSQADAGLIVAADGSHSGTREQLGLKTFGHAYDQQASVCLAEFSKGHEATAFQWFQKVGPLALLPLSEPGKVALIWSRTEPPEPVGDADFREEVKAATEGRLGDLTWLGPKFSFPLMQQHAWRYVAEGVALLGDAAHTIHPLAGQGANLGFADVRVLAQTVAAGRLEGKGPGNLSLLKRYERQRIREGYLAGLAMEGFYRLFASQNPLVRLVRGKGLRFVHGNAAIKRLAISVAAGGV